MARTLREARAAAGISEEPSHPRVARHDRAAAGRARAAGVSSGHSSHVRAIARAERSGTPDHVVASMHEAAAHAARAEGNHAAAERHARTASMLHENAAARTASPTNRTTSHPAPGHHAAANADAASAHARMSSMSAGDLPAGHRMSEAEQHGHIARNYARAAQAHTEAAAAHRAAGNTAQAEHHEREAATHASVARSRRTAAVRHVAHEAAQHTAGISHHGRAAAAPAAVQTGKHGGHFVVGPGGTRHYLPK